MRPPAPHTHGVAAGPLHHLSSHSCVAKSKPCDPSSSSGVSSYLRNVLCAMPLGLLADDKRLAVKVKQQWPDC